MGNQAQNVYDSVQTDAQLTYTCARNLKVSDQATMEHSTLGSSQGQSQTASVRR